jgi:hypothetical protein
MAHILLAHKLTYYGYTVDTLWKSIDRTGAGNLLQKEWPLEGESEGSEIDYLCTLYTLYTLYTYILIYLSVLTVIWFIYSLVCIHFHPLLL